MTAEHPKRRWVLGLLSIGLLIFLYRFFAVYTVRSGECRPKPVDASLRLLTRDERGKPVTYPERVGFRPQQRPLVVMSYNIAGHDELYDSDHIAGIAAVINQVKPDIVGLQEVHRGTWQARFHDQLAELERRTGMRGYFAPAYTQFGGGFGNAVLTRGEILSNDIHELPSIGEPRVVLESVIRIDGATIDFFTTHLTTWGSLNATNREEQLECLAKHVRTSRWPYILVGDFNAPPTAGEIGKFRLLNAAQLTGEDFGPTHPVMNKRIDYIFADYGWEARGARVLAVGPSDHWPITAELMWEREKR
ncbi:MAG TPA: endonuclease/exonuclease/phosphatase family protein [Thermoanaerobaculia bacterium]|nr:endonuclease/exonuclease/phosphatase family protein [Thermoanaerobaculia bacterium]